MPNLMRKYVASKARWATEVKIGGQQKIPKSEALRVEVVHIYNRGIYRWSPQVAGSPGAMHQDEG